VAIRRSTIFYPLIGLVVVCMVMEFASDTFLPGVRVLPTKLVVYGLSGLAASIVAVVLTSRRMSAQHDGGRGLPGGTLLVGVLDNGLNMMGVNPYV